MVARVGALASAAAVVAPALAGCSGTLNPEAPGFRVAPRAATGQPTRSIPVMPGSFCSPCLPPGTSCLVPVSADRPSLGCLAWHGTCPVLGRLAQIPYADATTEAARDPV